MNEWRPNYFRNFVQLFAGFRVLTTYIAPQSSGEEEAVLPLSRRLKLAFIDLKASH
jgi:hypothetical protein